MRAKIFLVSLSLLMILTVLLFGLKSNWAQEANPLPAQNAAQEGMSQEDLLQNISDKLDRVLVNQDKIQARLSEMQEDLIHKIKVFGNP